jgi:hypothetical protein
MICPPGLGSILEILGRRKHCQGRFFPKVACVPGYKDLDLRCFLNQVQDQGIQERHLKALHFPEGLTNELTVKKRLGI